MRDEEIKEKRSAWIVYVKGGPSHLVEDFDPFCLLTSCEVLMSGLFHRETQDLSDKCRECAEKEKRLKKKAIEDGKRDRFIKRLHRKRKGVTSSACLPDRES